MTETFRTVRTWSLRWTVWFLFRTLTHDQPILIALLVNQRLMICISKASKLGKVRALARLLLSPTLQQITQAD